MPHTPPPTPPAFILLTPINQSPNRGFGMDKAVSDRRWSLGGWLTGFHAATPRLDMLNVGSSNQQPGTPMGFHRFAAVFIPCRVDCFVAGMCQLHINQPQNQIFHFVIWLFLFQDNLRFHFHQGNILLVLHDPNNP